MREEFEEVEDEEVLEEGFVILTRGPDEGRDWEIIHILNKIYVKWDIAKSGVLERGDTFNLVGWWQPENMEGGQHWVWWGNADLCQATLPANWDGFFRGSGALYTRGGRNIPRVKENEFSERVTQYLFGPMEGEEGNAVWLSVCKPSLLPNLPTLDTGKSRDLTEDLKLLGVLWWKSHLYAAWGENESELLGWEKIDSMRDVVHPFGVEQRRLQPIYDWEECERKIRNIGIGREI